ncbi:MAG: type II toxin-antitoxin system RelE/ParE family toxin [Patescibacteria group bacterium]
MDYRIFYTHQAEKDIGKLDSVQAVRILKKMKEYVAQENPMKNAKKLKGFSLDTYRYRVGDYRVIFRLDPKNNTVVVLVVLRVAHHKEVYRN